MTGSRHAIRRAAAVEAQLAQLAHLLGATPGPRLVEDVAERLDELREEYEVARDVADEYRLMWAAAHTHAEQRRRALSRAVALLRRQRARRSPAPARDQ